MIFLGRKLGALRALEYLRERKIRIRIIINPLAGPEGPALRAFARRYKIPYYTDDARLYALIAKNDRQIRNIDLVISYLYPKKIKGPLLRLGRRGCINFHPAPLPENKGRAGYNTAILEKKGQFGVSAHFIDSEHFDVGPIIRVLRFPIDTEHESVLSLEQNSQAKLFDLFKSVITLFSRSERISTSPNVGGLYLTAKQLEEMKEVKPTDSLEDIHRKIRAFTFPPYHGATLKMKGESFTLLNTEMLQTIAQFMRGKK